MNQNWIGIALLFVGIIWFTISMSFSDTSIEEREYDKENYTETERLISILIEMSIVAYPTYKIMTKGWEMVIQKQEKDDK